MQPMHEHSLMLSTDGSQNANKTLARTHFTHHQALNQEALKLTLLLLVHQYVETQESPRRPVTMIGLLLEGPESAQDMRMAADASSVSP